MSGEGVSNLSELETAARDIKADWARGETPPTVVPAPDTPAVPAEAPPASPAEETPPPEVPPAPATPEEFIEALIREAEGDKPAEILKIPMGAKIPLKVNGEIVYRPAKDALTSGMKQEDYIGKTQEVAQHRRELEQHANQLIADRARMEAREKWITEERARLFEAQKSPEAWDRYQNHMRLMQEDPEYAKTFEDALEGRARKAEDVASGAAMHRQMVSEGVATVADWILEMGNEPKYANVDLDRVRTAYASALEQGTAALDQKEVRRIFDAEAQYLSLSLTPLQKELAELKAQVAKMAVTDPSVAHNRVTQHALDRAKAPPVNRGSPAAPVAPGRKVAPFVPRDWAEVNSEWNKRRD